jgi:hypothetical protein
LDDGVVIGQEAVGEESLLEVEPDAFDRIDLGRIGRQRHDEIARAVPASLVEHHGGVLVVADRRGEAVEEYTSA